MPTDKRLIALLNRYELVCPSCRYNLHKLGADVCPECGLTLTLRQVVLANHGKSLRSIEYGIPFNFFAPLVFLLPLGAAAGASAAKYQPFLVALAALCAFAPFAYLVCSLLIIEKKELRVADTAWRRRVLLIVWAPTIVLTALLPVLILML